MTAFNKCANIITRVPEEIGQQILREACVNVGTASVLTWMTQFPEESACCINLEVRWSVSQLDNTLVLIIDIQQLLQSCMLLEVHIVQQDLFLPLCHVHSPFAQHRCRFQHGCNYTAISRYLSTTGIRPLAVNVVLDRPGHRALNYNCITDLAPHCNQSTLKITINIPLGCSANIVRFLHPSQVLSARVTSLAMSPVEATPQLFETLLQFQRLNSLRICWGPLWPSGHQDWPPQSVFVRCLLPSVRKLYVEMGPKDHDSVSTLRLPNLEVIEVCYKMPTLNHAASDVCIILQPLVNKITAC
jgi:hypothetical protein